MHSFLICYVASHSIGSQKLFGKEWCVLTKPELFESPWVSPGAMIMGEIS